MATSGLRRNAWTSASSVAPRRNRSSVVAVSTCARNGSSLRADLWPRSPWRWRPARSDTLRSGSDSRVDATARAGRSIGTRGRADRTSTPSCWPISRASYRRRPLTSMWLMSPQVPVPKTEMKPSPNSRPQLGGEVPGVVGRILGAADGVGVQREHGQRADRLLVLREQDEGEIGIDRASRPHNLRIQHAGIEADGAVFQVEPAVEREPIVLGPHQTPSPPARAAHWRRRSRRPACRAASRGSSRRRADPFRISLPPVR